MAEAVDSAKVRPFFVLGSFVAAITLRVARLPIAGESVLADTLRIDPGGKGFNVAVGLARLGAATDGVIAIGDDRFGEMAGEALRRFGLPETMLIRCAKATGTGVGLIDAEGENLIAVHPGANLDLAPEHIARAADRIARAGSLLAQFEIGDAPIAAAFAAARPAGVRTLLNPSPYRPIPSAILTATDILIVNHAEAQRLARDLGGDDAREGWQHDLAQRLFAQGVEALVVTEGRAGARVWRTGAEPLFQPAFAVASIDTVGAGDAFLAGLAVTLAEGADWTQALRAASACGAMATLGSGVLDHLPSRGQLRAFLAARPVA